MAAQWRTTWTWNEAVQPEVGRQNAGDLGGQDVEVLLAEPQFGLVYVPQHGPDPRNGVIALAFYGVKQL